VEWGEKTYLRKKKKKRGRMEKHSSGSVPQIVPNCIGGQRGAKNERLTTGKGVCSTKTNGKQVQPLGTKPVSPAWAGRQTFNNEIRGRGKKTGAKFGGGGRLKETKNHVAAVRSEGGKEKDLKKLRPFAALDKGGHKGARKRPKTGFKGNEQAVGPKGIGGGLEKGPANKGLAGSRFSQDTVAVE